MAIFITDDGSVDGDVSFNRNNGSIDGDLYHRYGGMVISLSHNLFRRETPKGMSNLLKKYETLLSELNSEKDLAITQLDELTEPEILSGLRDALEEYIEDLTDNIEYITFIISQINARLLVLNKPIRDTFAPKNNRENDYIYNIHAYEDIDEFTFAPTYPVRFYR